MKIHRPTYLVIGIVFLAVGILFTIWGFNIEAKPTPKKDNIIEELFSIFEDLWNAIVALIKSLIVFFLAITSYLGALLFFILSLTNPKIKSNTPLPPSI